MAQHFILISSDYASGCRIGLHYLIDNSQNMELISKDIEAIRKYCKEDVQFATHKLITDSDTWESVVKSDGFFENIKIVNSAFELIKIINADRKLTANDIARYILSIMPCTHLKLEKLVYLCYADYLCLTGKKLFDDKIYAYKYGPVIQSVYDKYKIYKSQKIQTKSGDDKMDDILDLPFDESLKTPMLARIAFSYNGINTIESIVKTLSKYTKLTSSELVELTHCKNSPWDKVYNKYDLYIEIPDEIILSKHCNEC